MVDLSSRFVGLLIMSGSFGGTLSADLFREF